MHRRKCGTLRAADPSPWFATVRCRSPAAHRTYGTGPTYRKVGGRVLYTVRDLEDWSAVGERKSTREKTAGIVFPARPLTPEERGDR